MSGMSGWRDQLSTGGSDEWATNLAAAKGRLCVLQLGLDGHHERSLPPGQESATMTGVGHQVRSLPP